MCPQSQSPPSHPVDLVDVVFFRSYFCSHHQITLGNFGESPSPLLTSFGLERVGTPRGKSLIRRLIFQMSKGPLLTNSLSLFSFTVDKFFFIKVSLEFFFALFMFNNILPQNNSFFVQNHYGFGQQELRIDITDCIEIALVLAKACDGD